MKVGVSTASLFLRKQNEEALPLLNDLGVRTAEVFLTTFSEYETSFARQLYAKKGNVSINSVHILNTQFEPQLFGAHPRVQADAFFWLNKVLDCANVLGAPYYTFHGTARVKRASRSGDKDDFGAIVNGFQKIDAACKNKGVTLCLENVDPFSKRFRKSKQTKKARNPHNLKDSDAPAKSRCDRIRTCDLCVPNAIFVSLNLMNLGLFKSVNADKIRGVQGVVLFLHAVSVYNLQTFSLERTLEQNLK